VSRLSFQIDEAAALVGVKRSSPWASLRKRLFGADAEKWRDPAMSLPVSDGHDRAFLARRAFALRQPLAASSEPAIGIRPSSARSVRETMSASPGSGSYQAEYKDRLICASQLKDGSWIATHVPLGADPSLVADRQAQPKHRYLARILAIASAQIEIDELEQASRRQS
jgi:hypothetical protein